MDESPDQYRCDHLSADVRAAYRFILGREADPDGLALYCAMMDDGRLDWSGLRRIMLNSPEFVESATRYEIVQMDRGPKVVVDPSDPDFGGFLATHKTWEPHIVEAIRSHLRPGDTFVDIGANVGVMSFNAADAVGPTGRVFAFEPNPRNVSAYRRGLLANGFDHVTLFPFAASDRRHMVTVSSSSNAKVQDAASPIQALDVIQAVTVDELLVNEARIDLVKIDIEGWELPALQGASQTLSRHKPLVLLEFNPICLRSEGGIEPAILADFIFDRTSTVQVVEEGGSYTLLSSTSELLSLWAERDAYQAEKNGAPAGWHHLDLIFRS